MSLRHTSRHYREDIQAYLQAHAWAKRITVFSLLLIMLMVGLSLWRLLPIVQENPFIPLHYNIYIGIDRFGLWYNIFVLPILGLVFLILNISLAAQLSELENRAFRVGKGEPTLSRIVLWVTPLLEVVLFAGVIFTLLLNL